MRAMVPGRLLIAVTICWASCGLIAAPHAAQAQSAAEVAAARQAFFDGLALEEKSQFAEALEKFRRAAAVKKTPQIVFHVGLCEAKTGALVEAAASLQSALELAKAERNAQVENAARAELATLGPRVPTLELSSPKETPASISLDGKPLSSDASKAPIAVNPGSHEIVAQFAAGSVTRRVNVAESAHERVELEPPAAVEPVKPATPREQPKSDREPVRPEPAPERNAPSSPPVLGWALVGGGALAVIGGFVFWKLRSDKIDELDDMCPSQDDCPPDRASDVDAAEKSGRLYTGLGIGLWALGGAAIGTGSVLLFGGSGSGAEARLAPMVSHQSAGVGVRGAF